MQTYIAQSIFVSRTFWVNAVIVLGSVVTFLTAILNQTEVASLLSDTTKAHLVAAIAIVTALIGAVNVAMRTATVRPVALMAPDKTKAVRVKSLPHPNGRKRKTDTPAS